MDYRDITYLVNKPAVEPANGLEEHHGMICACPSCIELKSGTPDCFRGSAPTPKNNFWHYLTMGLELIGWGVIGVGVLILAWSL